MRDDGASSNRNKRARYQSRPFPQRCFPSEYGRQHLLQKVPSPSPILQIPVCELCVDFGFDADWLLPPSPQCSCDEEQLATHRGSVAHAQAAGEQRVQDGVRRALPGGRQHSPSGRPHVNSIRERGLKVALKIDGRSGVASPQVASQEKYSGDPRVEIEMARQFGSSASATLILQNEKEVIGWKNVAPISTLELSEYICIRVTANCIGDRSPQGPSLIASSLGIYACKMPKALKKGLAGLIAVESQQRKLFAKEGDEEIKLAEIDITSQINIADGNTHQVIVECDSEQLTVSIDPTVKRSEPVSLVATVKFSEFIKLDNGTAFIGICNESGAVMSNITIKSWWFNSSNLSPHRDAWNGLSLEYEPTWPVHLILSPEVLEKYNNMFRFLLPFRRIQILLHRDWVVHLRQMKSVQRGVYIRKLMNLRREVAFFVDNVMSYFQVDVLEAQWSKLELLITRSQDFEEVRKFHDEYLNNISSQCLVSMSKLVKALEEIIQVCMKMSYFLDRIENSEDYTSDMDKEYRTIKAQFENQSGLIFKMMSNVKKNQNSPFLSQLLLRLDYNEYYSRLAAGLDKSQVSLSGFGHKFSIQ
eukprot:TRINITY_DN9719_c0_g1_i11.p1 TRINITY_DN9719_c0_g1~~TRINITY_DN9719_c0_g1_i11.p1  ORF type:complete len:637 (+),score=139.02 TRINITY_DN9719_c0_g1_i11:150-1913(+)